MTLNNLIGYSNAGALGNAEYPFIVIAPKSTLVASDRVLLLYNNAHTGGVNEFISFYFRSLTK